MRRLSWEKVLNLALGLLLFLLPWQTIWITNEVFVGGVKWEYMTQGIYASEILLWLCVVLFLIWFRQRLHTANVERLHSLRQLRSPDRLFVLSCLVLVLYIFLSSFWSPLPAVARQHALWLLEAVLLFFMVLIGPLSSWSALSWFVYGAALQGVLATCQFLTQTTFSFSWLGLVYHPAWQAGTSVVSSAEIGRWLRAYGAFPHPNMLGGYLAAAIFLCVTFFLLKKQSEVKKQMHTILFLLPLITAGLFFSFSRSAWIAAGVAVSSSFIRVVSRRDARVSRSFSAICIVTFSVISLLFSPLLTTRLNPTSSVHEARSISERGVGYGEAIGLFKERPWFGTGVGQYTAALFLAQSGTPPIFAIQPVHNVLLLFITELGVVGALLLGVVAFAAALLIRPAIPQIGWSPLATITLGLIVLLSLDHYLFSLYSGPFLLAVAAGISLKEWLSTLHPPVIDRSV